MPEPQSGPSPPLATPADAARFGKKLPDDGAAALLATASARIRRAAGQEITVSEVTVRLPVERGAVLLPAPPVQAVQSVASVAAGGTATELVGWGWDGISLSGLGGAVLVEVVYTRGYDPVPEGIVELCCQVAQRLADTVSGMDIGIRQQSIDNYSVTFAVEQLDSAGDLLPGELAAIGRVLGAREVWVVDTV
ncbi:head-tail connector protein [Streptomyces celluloflavus]|uniref:hypothetical protein n=1 Tax=Streptomyces celluloflavus TaxID=58344 RepID=UPI0036C6BF5F